MFKPLMVRRCELAILSDRELSCIERVTLHPLKVINDDRIDFNEYQII